MGSLATLLLWGLVCGPPRGRLVRPAALLSAARTDAWLDEQIRLLTSELELSETAAEELVKHTTLVEADLLAKVRFLRTELGYPKARLREMISAHPKLMAACLVDDLESNMSTLGKGLQLSEEELRKITSKVPTLLRYDRQTVRARIAALMSPRGLGLSTQDARCVIRRCPSLLQLRGPEGRYRAIREILRELLEWEDEEILDVVKRFPSILKYNPASYHENFQTLKKATQMSEEELRTVFHKVPEALVYSLNTKLLLNKLAAIKSCCGFDDEDLRMVCRVFPTILKISTQNNLVPKITAIREFFDYSTPDLRKLCMGNKRILGASLEKNIKPKFEFLSGPLVASMSRKEIGRKLLDRPRVLGFSLEHRIRPRFQRLLDAGVKIESLSSWTFLELTDAKFDKFMEKVAPALHSDPKPRIKKRSACHRPGSSSKPRE